MLVESSGEATGGASTGSASSDVTSRVRVVRSEMEPVWRKLLNGGRKQFRPLVKGESEQRLIERLEADLLAARATWEHL